MNYTYVYQKISIVGDRVIEYHNGVWHTLWVADLLRDGNVCILKEEEKSYMRTKKWLKENHPELFL